MKKRINTITCFTLMFTIIFSLFAYTQVSAYSEDPYIISGEIYYIKNMYSGQYLDVDHK